MKTVDLNRHFEQMLICAVQYALGRRTYIVSDTVEYVLARKDDLSDWCKRTIARDIKEKIRECFRQESLVGDECDHREWVRLLNELEET